MNKRKYDEITEMVEEISKETDENRIRFKRVLLYYAVQQFFDNYAFHQESNLYLPIFLDGKDKHSIF